MFQYLQLIERTLKRGDVCENRTGIDTIRTDGDMMRFDLREGYPAVTTKKLAFKSMVGEYCAFMRSARSAADFRALGSKVWDQNANENKAWLANPFRTGEDDLGPVYGVQWRKWPAYKTIPSEDNPLLSEEEYVKVRKLHDKLVDNAWIRLVSETNPGNEKSDSIYYKEIDQLGGCLRTIIKDPDNRRILFHGWNPAVLDEVALPACHLLYQFLPNKNTKEMSMTLTIRSNDLGLGAPFNIASAALMLEVMCHMTGYTARYLTIFISDCHIYVNHLDMVNEQLIRKPFKAPTLKINDRIPTYNVDDNVKFMDETGETQIEHLIEWLALAEPSDFTLENYEHHPAIAAPMAV